MELRHPITAMAGVVMATLFLLLMQLAAAASAVV